jgi:hypothetical protein
MYEKDLAAALAGVAVRRGARGFTFDDLIRAGARERVTISHVANWLAGARSSGFVEDMGFDDPIGGVYGPRRYRIASTTYSSPSRSATSARRLAGP